MSGFREASIHLYVKIALLTERLHRRFLDCLRLELDRRQVVDINAVQALVLYNIGRQTVAVGELTERGYYVGSNVSYIVKNLVITGYVARERSRYDKRSNRLTLTEKGLHLYHCINIMFARHITAMRRSEAAGIDLAQLTEQLESIERLWCGYIESVPKPPPLTPASVGTTPLKDVI